MTARDGGLPAEARNRFARLHLLSQDPPEGGAGRRRRAPEKR